MIKFTQGGLGNLEGATKDIIVKAKAPNKLVDILIGGGMVLAGVGYLTYTAFRHGAKMFEVAEIKTMIELGIIKEDPYT